MTWKRRTADVANRLLRRFDIQVMRGADLWRPATQLGLQPPAGPRPAGLHREPVFAVFSGAAFRRRPGPADWSVVMPTTLRPTIRDALNSIFRQDFPGTVQILVGVDQRSGDPIAFDSLVTGLADNQSVVFFDPGYSTSVRHGGLHPSYDGGVLRTVLSYLADSRYVSYLDDDNWWAPEHIATLHAAIQGHDWAYTDRWFVHPGSRQPIARDAWESVGPGRGILVDAGGWVDPNCLAIDKLACEAVLRWWSIPQRNSRRAMDADQNVFLILSREFKGRGTGRATVYYAVDETDDRHATRLALIGEDAYAVAGRGAAIP
jgi:hypothetical protein